MIRRSYRPRRAAFDCLHGVEGEVVEELFAYIVPLVFGGIKIRVFGGEPDRHDIL